ncbi:type II toxin-antitoxin system CcdA family antitoxin [Sphingomonas sp. HF-S3]|uniref:Type II toxin-antitoxin system CcdA family antitoxin n=1 Tax=Sphingomonas rustica TaxID=3103142 RepID=A0ABV0BAF2_9SPHN
MSKRDTDGNVSDSSRGTASSLQADCTERDSSWQKAHREAIAVNNAWVEKHGLPLARYRQF